MLRGDQTESVECTLDYAPPLMKRSRTALSAQVYVTCFSSAMLKDTVRNLEATFRLSLVPFGKVTHLSRQPASRKVLQRIH